MKPAAAFSSKRRSSAAKVEDAGQAAPDDTFRGAQRKGVDRLGHLAAGQPCHQALDGLTRDSDRMCLGHRLAEDPLGLGSERRAADEGPLAALVEDLQVDEGAIRLARDVLQQLLEAGDLDGAPRLEPGDRALELDAVASQKLGDLAGEPAGLEAQEALFDEGEVLAVVGREQPPYQGNGDHGNENEGRRDGVGERRTKARQESHVGREKYIMGVVYPVSSATSTAARRER